MTSSRTLVFYHYFEDGDAMLNLKFFLEVGYNSEADFIIILAGGCSIDLPSAENINYIFTVNRNYDFGGYAQAIKDVEVSKYDYFVFINSSARGPFYLASSVTGPSWIDAFTSKLKGEIGICGATVNILRSPSDHLFWLTGLIIPGGVAPHVQTYAYALRQDAFTFLIDSGFYSEPAFDWSKDETIAKYEIELSLRLLGAGWNLDCLAGKYSGLDYRTVSGDPNGNSFNGSSLVPNGYFGHNIDPSEVLFVKPKRSYAAGEVLERLNLTFGALKKGNGTNAYKNCLDGPLFEIKTAWRGHRNFARWIVNKIKPGIIVDLGVDFGFSTLSFACFARDKNLNTVVYGIDSFEGDVHAGERNTYMDVSAMIHQLELNNVQLIRGYFQDIAKDWSRSIDVLHIDGLHTYEAVSQDFYDWSNFVSETGLILMHDTCVPHFGVRQVFEEVALPKLNFKIWNGLGVMSKSSELIGQIAAEHSAMLE